MKLSVKNLGRIESAELDIKPLTVFFGPNGTNKTWLAANLFALVRSCSRAPFPFPSIVAEDRSDAEHIHFLAAVSPLLDATDTPDAPDVVEVEYDLHSAIGSSDIVSDTSPEMIRERCGGVDATALPAPSIEIKVFAADAKQRLPEFRVRFTKSEGRLEIVRKRGNRTIRIQATRDWDRSGLLDFCSVYFFSVFESVLFFPADRAGLVAASSSLAELSREGLPIVAQTFLNDLDVLRRQQVSEWPLLPEAASDPRLFGGRVVVSNDDAREIRVDVGNGLNLPITAAASVARTNAALMLHLHRIAGQDDVILIDELELNAHPQAQLALVELMATLVNAGIRVVFTTHSPYVVDHLNNLLVAGRLPEAKHEEAEKLLTLGTRQAFLSTDDVAAYRFVEEGEKVRVENAIDQEYGQIVDATFAGATDKVMNLYGELRDLEDRE